MQQVNLTRLAPSTDYQLLVIGGCGGIGRCLVNAALTNGLKVAVFDLEASFKTGPLPPQVLQAMVNATKIAEVTRAMKTLETKWGGLDGLVNLAGFMGDKNTIDDFNPSHWESIFSASFDSTLNSCKASIPLLRKRAPHASIVNMSSGLANVCSPGYGPYSSAKAAIVALTKSLARENAPDVRCNAVSPGGINTPFLTGGTGRKATAARIDPESYAKLVPLARMGEPEDVVGPILFLLSQAAGYMTGQVLHIDGGAWMP